MIMFEGQKVNRHSDSVTKSVKNTILGFFVIALGCIDGFSPKFCF